MGRSRITHAGRALTEKQDRFVRLIAHGVSNREACRLVGINRRTGTRWRLGRTIANTAGEAVHYPPVHIAAPRTRHPRYLSLDERMVIADLRREQRTVREIARELGRSPATVSRELRRNVDDRGRYLPRSADLAATERVARPRARRVTVDAELRAVVVDLLGKRWSPEQVSHELQGRFTDQPARRLCVESIYQAIYDPDAPVTRPAKRRRRRRRRRVQGLERRGRLTAMTMIADRPAEVADRAQVGHWEGDCVRHEALCNRAEVKDLRRCAVAAASRSWGQPEPGDDGEGGKQPRQRRDEPVLPDGSGPASMRRRCTRETSVLTPLKSPASSKPGGFGLVCDAHQHHSRIGVGNSGCG